MCGTRRSGVFWSRSSLNNASAHRNKAVGEIFRYESGLRQIGAAEGDEGGAGYTVNADQIDRGVEKQILHMETAVTIELFTDCVLDGIERLVLGAQHIARHSDTNRLARLQTVARQIFAAVLTAGGIDIELSDGILHGVAQGIGAGGLDFAAGLRGILLRGQQPVRNHQRWEDC